MQKGNLKRNSDQASSSIPKRGSKGSKSAGSNRNVSYSTKKNKKSGLQDDSPKNFSSSAEEEETQEAATSTAQETVHRSDSIPKAPSTIENFEELRNSSVNYAFVDKTPLIKRIIEHEDKTMLILRPRRWGKSLNLSMLYSYLSNKKANEFDKLFKGTQIYGDKAFMTSHANQYPVIYIDFSKFALKTTVTDESWLGRSFCTSLAQVQKDYEKRIQDTKVKTLSRTAKDQALNHFNEKHAGLANAIQHLSYALNQMFNKNVIVLIDEYDLPIHKQLNAGSDDDMKSLLNFYKDFLEIGLKNNTNMFKCVMTGCARVGLTDTLSGLNNFNSYSMLDKDFHEFYGFSQAEVLSLIKSIRVTPEIDEDERKAIKSYYNGYICPAGSKCTEIYNAYSIVKYAASGKFDAFWNMAGGDSLIVRAFRNKEADTEEKLYKLIAGEEIKVNLSPKITLEMLETAEVIGATLFYAGYVTLAKDKLTPVKDRPEVDKERDVYAIKVPNAEVTEALIDLLKRLHIKMQGSTDIQIRDAFISDELDLFVKQVNIWISKQKTSENITGRTLSSEPCYHNLLYWNLSRILEKQFIVRSERYAGKGFFDIVVFPQRGKELSTAYVFEIKFLAQTFDDNKAAKMAKMDEAKHQINDRRYLDYFNNNKEFDYIGTKKKFGILGCNSKIELYDFQ